MDDFLQFVVERHRIWERRLAGDPGPWTDDPVLASHKFTNVFRVLDPGTQYILQDLITLDCGPRTALMRLFLYRHTGNVDAWEWLDLMQGLPHWKDLEQVRVDWQVYRATGARVFTGAYNIHPQNPEKGADKLDGVINLTQRLFTPGSPEDVVPDFLEAQTQEQRFKVLQRNKGVGNFMAMQILTDWGYLGNVDREDEFLVPGPGSVNGAKALNPDQPVQATVAEVLRAVREVPGSPRLYGRPPSLMDVGSNLLCEWSKYVRFRARGTHPKPYTPAHPGPQPAPVVPYYYYPSKEVG